MIKELADRQWRLDNIYSIVNKKGVKTRFRRNNIQRLLSKETAQRKMVLKSRQVGISTNELIQCADTAFFYPNKTVCILAHEQDAIEKLFRIVRHAYETMHEFPGVVYKPELDRGGGSKYELFFPKLNSRIYCDLESRGDTIHQLHVSEVAFMKDLTRLKATLECVPFDTGKVTWETTANGMNHFYQAWMDEQSNYKKCFYPWFFHEEYQVPNHELTAKMLTKDEKEFISRAKTLYKTNITLAQIAFRRFKQADQKEAFKQEYPEDDITCFLTSGNSPMNLEIVKPLYDAAKPPIEEIDGIKIYEKKKDGEFYVVAADTAEGVEGDNSAGHVFKVSNREQVASFASNTHKPSEFGAVLVQMAELYSTKSIPPLLAVERNNHGHAVLLYLDEIARYPNLFRHKKEDKKGDINDIKLGWITDKVTRPIMIDTLIESVENGTTILRDKSTLGECLTLVNNNGKIEADEGNHDDRVVAAAIGVQMCIEESVMGIYANVGAAIKI